MFVRLLLPVLLLTSACATRPVRLEADGGEGTLAPAARYALASDDGTEAAVVVEAEGARSE